MTPTQGSSSTFAVITKTCFPKLDEDLFPKLDEVYRTTLVSSESQQYLGLGGSSSYQPGSNYETVSELERCLHLSLLSPNRCLNRSK